MAKAFDESKWFPQDGLLTFWADAPFPATKYLFNGETWRIVYVGKKASGVFTDDMEGSVRNLEEAQRHPQMRPVYDNGSTLTHFAYPVESVRRLYRAVGVYGPVQDSEWTNLGPGWCLVSVKFKPSWTLTNEEMERYHP